MSQQAKMAAIKPSIYFRALARSLQTIKARSPLITFPDRTHVLPSYNPLQAMSVPGSNVQSHESIKAQLDVLKEPSSKPLSSSPYIDKFGTHIFETDIIPDRYRPSLISQEEMDCIERGGYDR